MRRTTGLGLAGGLALLSIQACEDDSLYGTKAPIPVAYPDGGMGMIVDAAADKGVAGAGAAGNGAAGRIGAAGSSAAGNGAAGSMGMAGAGGKGGNGAAGTTGGAGKGGAGGNGAAGATGGSGGSAPVDAASNDAGQD